MSRGLDDLRSKGPEDALEWALAVHARLFELCDRYGIRRPGDDDAAGWFMLALRLALEHEPGLYPFPSKGGAPRGDGLINHVRIFTALARAEAQGKSVSAAANHLAKKPGFDGVTAGSIRVRFYKLKNPNSERDQSDRRRLTEFMRHLQEKAVG